jgi:preprotein translocase subunit SecG
MEIALGIAVIVLSLFLIVAVLMQSGKDTRLSGTIAGGAETFFGKTKANTWDRVLSKLTVVVSIVFAVLVVVMYVFVS